MSCRSQWDSSNKLHSRISSGPIRCNDASNDEENGSADLDKAHHVNRNFKIEKRDSSDENDDEMYNDHENVVTIASDSVQLSTNDEGPHKGVAVEH